MTMLTTEYLDQQLAADLVFAFNPRSLPGCAFSGKAGVNVYKDAAQASPATLWADQVQQWRDEAEAVGGSTYPYLSQATAGSRPTLAPQAFQTGGLRFVNQRMQFNNLTGVDKSNCTIAVTGILFTDFSQLLSPVYVSLDTVGTAMTLQADGTNVSLNIQPDANYDAADHPAGTLSLPLSPYTVLTLQSASAGVTLNVNGTSSATSAAAAAHIGTNGWVGDWSNLNSTLAGGWIGRVVVYSPALSPANLLTLQQGLLSEANLQSLWPSTWNVVAFLGDSLTQGVGHGTITVPQTYPAQTISLLTQPVGYLLAALSGKTIDQAASAWTAGINGHFLGTGRTGKQVVSFWCGTNDIAAGGSGAAVKADYQTRLQAFKTAGWQAVCFSVMNNAGFNSAAITQQGILNAALRADFTRATSNPNVWLPAAGITYADVFVDVQNEVNLQNTSNTTYFSDGTHLTALGYSIPAADEVVALAHIGVS